MARKPKPPSAEALFSATLDLAQMCVARGLTPEQAAIALGSAVDAIRIGMGKKRSRWFELVACPRVTAAKKRGGDV